MLSSHSQKRVLLFKRNTKTIRSFHEGFYIDFQTRDRQWVHGVITKISNDSFYLTKEFVTFHLMGSDTSHISGFSYSLADIYGMPNKGIKIEYMNSRFQINRGAGHVHFYWIKSGYIFRLGALAYAAVHLINGALFSNFTFSPQSLGIAAGVFLPGKLLKYTYKPVLRLKGKYRFQILSLS
jgi:hypothetical protein